MTVLDRDGATPEPTPTAAPAGEHEADAPDAPAPRRRHTARWVAVLVVWKHSSLINIH